jgi:V/A-type H+-transporting ATPase subunit D
MAKIKLTKGELKKQRDSLRQFLRYLPTLQLKKQQLQSEILGWGRALQEKTRLYNTQKNAVLSWSGLLTENAEIVKQGVHPQEIVCGTKSIAGIEVKTFEEMRFTPLEYDLFLIPAWVDPGIESLRQLVSAREEIKVIGQAIEALKRELRITAQRVNLFEKVKIPEAVEAIRKIKIYIGDQMANAVGRSKIAKRKIEALELLEAAI